MVHSSSRRSSSILRRSNNSIMNSFASLDFSDFSEELTPTTAPADFPQKLCTDSYIIVKAADHTSSRFHQKEPEEKEENTASRRDEKDFCMPAFDFPLSQRMRSKEEEKRCVTPKPLHSDVEIMPTSPPAFRPRSCRPIVSIDAPIPRSLFLPPLH